MKDGKPKDSLADNILADLRYIPDLNPFFECTDEEKCRAETLFELGEQYEFGDGLLIYDADYSKALKIYQKLADCNYAPALNKLGQYYESIGKLDEAKEFYIKASDFGCSDALVNLGNMYEFNTFKLDEIDWKSAVEYYHKAALLGNSNGLFNYANCLHWGHGVKRDYKMAYWLFDKLTQRGNTDAWFYIGLYHEKGLVVEKSIDNAEYYYKKGAASGDPYCYANLGKIYADRGYEAEKAVKCYLDAISRGDVLGYAGIGKMYEDGQISGKKDQETAIKWYSLAVENGFDEARQDLERLGVEGKMYPKSKDAEMALKAECLFAFVAENWREQWLNELREAVFDLMSLYYKDLWDSKEFDEFSIMRDLERIGIISAVDRKTKQREVLLSICDEYNEIIAPLEKGCFDASKEWPDEIGPKINHWYLDKIKPEYIQYLSYEIYDPVDYKGGWSLKATLNVNGKDVRISFKEKEDNVLYDKLIKMVESHADKFDIEGSLQNPVGKLEYFRKSKVKE